MRFRHPNNAKGKPRRRNMDTDTITEDSQGNASTFPDADLTHALYMLELKKPLPLDLAARLLERGLDVSTIERKYA